MCSSETIVKLNVGGSVFETWKSTLTKQDGFFKTLVETNIPVKKDTSDCYFIDRSPKYFETVLNYMRSGVTVLPDSEKELQELKKEAEFYLLEQLVDLCEPINNQIRTYRSSHELLQIIASTKKPVVVINYITHNNDIIYIPEGFRFDEFVKKNSSVVEIYFQPMDNREPLPKDLRRHRGMKYYPEPVWSYRIYNSTHSGCVDLTAMDDLQKKIDSILNGE
ncbi:BTB domain-containing protein [Caenorhabditis elegans]|uniref:BTB domain-containing protein n=1 Tax=Caenorhabditis elegans TaxID=6239 RepID=Q9TZA6_CAEEL|nr:BTB domain-containing protein [Caenorhabditis elegans]CCD66468.1 BTB domain-containing protein [Caenorhabditis elegans]|eukprot:NP_494199.1 Uncharacterized protein CELE_C40A11.7 [Caenorhabditis elegans]